MAESSCNLVYRNSTPEDVEQIIDLLIEGFIEYEPLSRSTHLQGLLTSDNFLKMFQGETHLILSPYTVVVSDGDKVVGVRVVGEMAPQEYETLSDFDQVGPIQEFIHQLAQQKTKSLEEFPTFLILKFSAVAKEYQNRGITGKMADWVIERAREDKIPAIVSESTGLYSQSALLRRGFQCISELFYADYKNENGELIFKHTHPHVSTKMLLLVL